MHIKSRYLSVVLFVAAAALALADGASAATLMTNTWARTPRQLPPAPITYVLSTRSGTWTGGPTTYTYHWQDCTPAGIQCHPIAGATNSTYTLGTGDVGSTLRLVATGTNGTEATSQASVLSKTAPAGLSNKTSCHEGHPYPSLTPGA